MAVAQPFLVTLKRSRCGRVEKFQLVLRGPNDPPQGRIMAFGIQISLQANEEERSG